MGPVFRFSTIFQRIPWRASRSVLIISSSVAMAVTLAGRRTAVPPCSCPFGGPAEGARAALVCPGAVRRGLWRERLFEPSREHGHTPPHRRRLHHDRPVTYARRIQNGTLSSTIISGVTEPGRTATPLSGRRREAARNSERILRAAREVFTAD